MENNSKYTADELLYQVYKDICETGDVSLQTTIKITEYIMNKHGK